MADGNNTDQQPNLVPGVSLIPPGGQTITNWINKAAFSVPAPDTWGSAGTYIVRGPGLLQPRRHRIAQGIERYGLAVHQKSLARWRGESREPSQQFALSRMR